MNAAHPIMQSVRVDEDARLSALDRYDILDTRQEESFDRIARLIKLTLNAEIGLVSLMDANRQWYKAIEGSAGKEVPLDLAFCRHMLLDGRAFVVPDTMNDVRFKEHPYEPWARMYDRMPERPSVLPKASQSGRSVLLDRPHAIFRPANKPSWRNSQRLPWMKSSFAPSRPQTV